MKKYFLKNWSNILFLVFLALLIIPQTRMPIMVTAQRLIAFSPSQTPENQRKVLKDYDWMLTTFEDEPYSFREAENQVIVLNFWATWCPPCVAEMPSFQKLYDDYGNQVEFLFVTSEEKERVEAFMERRGYDLPVYFQRYAAPEQLESRALPTTFVISKKGEIAIKETGVADWNSKKVRNLLDSLLEE